VNVIVNVIVGWQVSNIGHQTSTHRSETYHLLIKMSKLSHWHWLMTMETMQTMKMEMEKENELEMEMKMSTTWHSYEILCEDLMWHDASAKCFLSVLPTRNDKCLTPKPTHHYRKEGQHSARIHIHCVWEWFHFFELQDSYSVRHSTNHPTIHLSIFASIRQCWESLLKPSSA